MRLLPDNVRESVSVTRLQNYQEKFDISAISFENMKRYHDVINCEPILTPVHFKDSLVLFHNCTKKRCKSTVVYEPKLKPRNYSESLVIYPKRPEKVFVSCIDHHIDACRKWFKTTVEFTAKTITTTRVKKGTKQTNPLKPEVLQNQHDQPMNGHVSESDDQQTDAKPASSVLFPRFEKYQRRDSATERKSVLVNEGLTSSSSESEVQGYNGDISNTNEEGSDFYGSLVNDLESQVIR